MLPQSTMTLADADRVEADLIHYFKTHRIDPQVTAGVNMRLAGYAHEALLQSIRGHCPR
jgi:hypothetical protein